MTEDLGADGVAIVCCWDGTVEKILYDRLELHSGLRAGEQLASAVDEASREKCMLFLDTIRTRRAAFEWQMDVVYGSDLLPVYFSGAAVDRRLLILGTPVPAGISRAQGELIRIQNELVNAMRAGLKELTLRSRGEPPSHGAGHAETESALAQYLGEFGTDLRESKRVSAEMASAKAAAESASRSKSAFIAHMGHELKTPLNSVIGFTDLLRRNKAKNLRERDLQYLERISSNAHHLLRLINSVLDLARLEAGRVQLQLTPISVPELIRETVAQLWSGDADSAVKVEVSIPEPVADVTTDAGKLKQILINLIGNALKFTERGTVTVAVEVDGPSRRPIRIDVIDTGIGIPADRLESVFMMFEQADPATGRRYGGAGLGLAISRSLSDLLGYRLVVTSEVGRGSKFSVLLEAVAGNPQPTNSPLQSAAGGT